MGYYSTIEIYTDQEESINKEILQNLRSSNEEAEAAIDDEGRAQFPVKWYEIEIELKEFSKKYPEALFTVDVLGEEANYSKLYFRNGKYQSCYGKIIYEPYNEDNFK